MARIIKFPASGNSKFGYKKVRKRKSVDLEDYGQLNLFTVAPSEAKVVSLSSHGSLFDHALYFDENNDPRAVEFYWKAIKSGEGIVDSYCNLGIIESEKKNYANAIDCFTQCLKHDPRHCEAHYNLANIYSELGDLDLAKVHYQMAIKIDADFESAYYNLGLVMAMKSEYKEALEILRQYRLFLEDDDKGNVDKLIDSLQKTMKSKTQ